MINCKQIPLPKLGKEDLQKIISFFTMGHHLFDERYGHHAWKSFDIVKEGNTSPMIKHFPSIVRWLITCRKHTAIRDIEHLYLSILMPRNQIPWHVDMQQTDIYANSIITSISTANSFIEFENDKQYHYREGYSYLIKSGVKHRIMNLSDEYRVTLCLTPKENPYADMA